MNKTAKGALAASSAAVLLLGGAGTLAFWSDSATVNGGSVDSGYLTLDAVGCDAGWTYANGSNAGAPVVSFVPGDQIAKTCTFTVGAEGDNLEASPTVPASVPIDVAPEAGAPGAGSGDSFAATVGATYTLGGTALTEADTITEADDGETLAARLLVTIPFGSATVNGNDTQNVTATLDTLTVSLTQDLGEGNPNA